jgi:nitrite reductase/ring-hydroxylating ferredoxin subunit
VICSGAVLENGGTGVRFEVRRQGKALPAFVVRFHGVVRAYVNECKHQSTELDWDDGDFFDERGIYLMCSSHGATYDPATGICVAGPCKGACLSPVAVSERDGDVHCSEE